MTAAERHRYLQRYADAVRAHRSSETARRRRRRRSTATASRSSPATGTGGRRNVVIATGWCDRPAVPDLAEPLDPAIDAGRRPRRTATRPTPRRRRARRRCVGHRRAAGRRARRRRAVTSCSPSAATAACPAATGAWTSSGGSSGSARLDRTIDEVARPGRRSARAVAAARRPARTTATVDLGTLRDRGRRARRPPHRRRRTPRPLRRRPRRTRRHAPTPGCAGCSPRSTTTSTPPASPPRCSTPESARRSDVDRHPHDLDLRERQVRHRSSGPPATGAPTRGCACPCSTSRGEIRHRHGVTAGRPASTCSASASSTAATRTSSTASAATPPSSPTTSSRRTCPSPVRLNGADTHVHQTAPRYDAVIVGARAAGAATAMLLARAGLRVLVVDRSRYGADTLSTHALDARPASSSCTAGASSTGSSTPARRRPPHHVPLRRRATSPCRSSRRYGVDALYAPRRTVLDPVLVDAAVAAGAEVRYGITVTGVSRDRAGRVIGVDGRDDRGHRPPSTPHSSSAPTACARRVARRVDAPIEARGTGATAPSSTATGPASSRRLRVGLPARRLRRGDPHQRRPDLRVRRGAPARIGRGGRRRAASGARARPSPSTAARVRAGAAPPGVRTLRRPRRLPAAGLGPGLGARRRRRLLEGPDQRPRPHRRAARRRAAGPSDRDRAARRQLPRRTPSPRTRPTRDRLSLPLFDVVDAIAGQRWTDREIGPLLLQLSAAMADEVEAVSDFDKLGALDTLEVA